jgi:hypothetical protein
VALVDQIMRRIARGLKQTTDVDSLAATRMASAFTLASRFLNVPLLEAVGCQPIDIND